MVPRWGIAWNSAWSTLLFIELGKRALWSKLKKIRFYEFVLSHNKVLLKLLWRKRTLLFFSFAVLSKARLQPETGNRQKPPSHLTQLHFLVKFMDLHKLKIGPLQGLSLSCCVRILHFFSGQVCSYLSQTWWDD